MDKMTDTGFDVEQLNLLIRSRRSVFTDQFEKGKVAPDAIIKEILENANWAPNHKQTEPWRFVVFKGEGLIKLAQFQSDLYRQHAGEKFKQGKYEKLLATPAACPHAIAIGMKRNAHAGLPEMEEIEAVSCAVQNIYLSVTAYGLGGYWSTGGITYIQEAKPFFGLEKDDLLLGFFYIGYVKIPSGKGSRRAVEEKTTWVDT